MAAPSATVAHLRASKARRLQSYPPDHPKVREVGQALDYAKLSEHAAKVVADWPDPPPEMLAEVAAILRCGGASDAGRCPTPSRSAIVAERLAVLDGGAPDA